MTSPVSMQQLIDAGVDCGTIASIATSTADTVVDRLGQTKFTMVGACNKIGFEQPTTYSTSGQTLTRPTQTVVVPPSELLYAPAYGTIFPFTTSGVFNPLLWRAVDTNALSTLQTSSGAGLVGKSGAGTVQDFIDNISGTSGYSYVGNAARKQELEQETLNNQLNNNWQRFGGDDLGIVASAALKVVITGDSLSYNCQDFDSVLRAEAAVCYPGMNSWAFALRDAIIRDDPNFKHGDELVWVGDPQCAGTGNAAFAKFQVPFNGRMLQISASAQSAVFTIKYKQSSTRSMVRLWLMYNPTATKCSIQVKVDGVNTVSLWNLDGTGKINQGYQLHALDIVVPNDGKYHDIQITNFIGAGSSRDVYLCGIGASSLAFDLTGKGDQSSKWLADNVAPRVVAYNPDIVIMIIGANDGWVSNPQGLQTPAQYKANLLTIVNAIRANKAGTRILLMSPPQTNGSVVSVPTMQTYIDAGRQFALDNNITFFDTASFFSKTQIAAYRFDSIHFNKSGNQMLLAELSRLLGVPVNDVATSMGAGAYYATPPLDSIGTSRVKFTGSTPTITSLSAGKIQLVTSVVRTSPSLLRFYLACSTTLHIPSVAQQVSSGVIDIKKMIIAENYIDIFLSNPDGTPVLQASWDSPARVDDFNFIVT